MGEQTMYERIMSLPLFKGVGAEHVSLFLEKTSLKFENFSSGEVIARRGEDIKSLRFILSGGIRVTTPLYSDRVNIVSTLRKDVVIGADRLFGINTKCDSDIFALDRVSVMEFSKEKYLALLRSDPIYLINYANALSMKSQIVADTFRNIAESSFAGIISRLLIVYTSKNSEDVKIDGISALSILYPHIDFNGEISRLEEIECGAMEDDSFIIYDRNLFIDRYRSNIEVV